ncbi:MAG: UDP-N-acetylglucosamine--LPS N-acetylglucosamine transferase [Chloroflexales bacterium]|nr:UDP-N-acetylglucosamine--LPS N-acetylglucosamine transferase [Chloroflexales bacterium]
MRRILILHALLGTGHLSAARALESAFRCYPGVEPIVEDSLDFINPALAGLWKRGYKELSERAAEVYSRVYDATDQDDAGKAAIENLRGAERGRHFFRRLDQYVAELRPDAVIAVMPVPLALMSRLKAEGHLPAPLYAVITDFVAHSSWIVPHVSRYFVPGELTATLLSWQAFEPSRLTVTGIPINPAIAEPKERGAVRAQRGFPLERPLVTIFGGGVAVTTIRQIVFRLLQAPRPLSLAVCAGRNEELLQALADLGDGPQTRLWKLGLIDYVDDLVAASDLVISKPGGLITSEVLARGTPMIAIEPLPGQEEANADAVGASGAGIALRVASLAPLAALHILGQPGLREAMAANARREGRPRAALTIAEHVLADLDTEES